MLLSLHPYLSFNGNCEAAFNFYSSVFGGEFDELHRYSKLQDEDIPESEKDKIMHISLQIAEHIWLMGADVLERFETPTIFGDNVCLSICTASEAETIRVCNALSEGGTIEEPLEETEWADLYACFTDKFGICWAVSFNKKRK